MSLSIKYVQDLVKHQERSRATSFLAGSMDRIRELFPPVDSTKDIPMFSIYGFPVRQSHVVPKNEVWMLDKNGHIVGRYTI